MARPKLACKKRGRKKDAQNPTSAITNIDPYEGLANAIIIQAAKDYSNALERLKVMEDTDAEREKSSIETFFRSEWYQMLTGVDPELLIKMLREQTTK